MTTSTGGIDSICTNIQSIFGSGLAQDRERDQALVDALSAADNRSAAEKWRELQFLLFGDDCQPVRGHFGFLTTAAVRFLALCPPELLLHRDCLENVKE